MAIAQNELHDAQAASTKHQGPKLPFFDLPYTLDKPTLNFLTDRFPRTRFRCSADLAHDHPIAHAETMIANARAQRMIPAGHTVIDLFGDPSAADRLNVQQARSTNPKRWVPYVCLKSEKDFLRSLNWGDQFKQDGTRRYVEGSGDLVDEILENGRLDPRFGNVDSGKLTYYSKHTIYYMSDEEISSLLRVEGSRMVALVHRHPDDTGKMFNGECSYAKVGQGTVVEQVNVLTGERYVHRDMSWLWTSTTKVKRTAVGAFVWTFHMVSPETWIVVLTGCPSHLDERFAARARVLGVASAAHEMNEHAEAPSPFPHPALAVLPTAQCKLLGGVPVISFANADISPVRLTCPALFDFLFSTMVGKPRDSDRLHDLFALARSHIANGSDFPGKRNFAVSPPDIAGHVVLAYVAGLQEETVLLRSLEFYRVWSHEHHALLDGAAIVVPNGGALESAGKTAISVLKRVNASRKAGDTFDGILRAIE